MRTTYIRRLAPVLALLLAACSGESAAEAAPAVGIAREHAIEAIELGSIGNVHACGDMLLAGQPAPADSALLAGRGIERVLDLRTEGEVGFDEASAVAAAGLEYVHVPFRTPAELTDEKLDRVREVLREAGEHPVLVHCGVASRVGGVWLAWRVLDAGGVTFDEALVDAKEIGLRSDELAERVRVYVEARQ